ncbi:MAG: Holliday junction branch migration protein RuvA [Segniliparus sp.]|uniref:Holliday junction branch migration protein RuvA n=1 Tax=Segniliparus sp. TaxID=2804064 RepID=UPI003F308D46
MIASVRGEAVEVGADHIVVECAGLGYHVVVLPSTAVGATKGTQLRLVTSFIVREDAQTLYGFPDRETRDLFDVLRTVSGVGPKLAMAVLSVLEPAQLRRAIGEGDLAVLTKVPGVGKRVAERLALELKEKVGAPGGALGASGGPEGSALVRQQVVDGLVGLGFALKPAESAADSVLVEDPDASAAVALRGALAILGKNR